uniref:Uncharacterized protein n=1 Tax=Cacopsylla melanoneura TaxID=428564 RepID=A0A8D8Q7R3_9HEMI
MNVSSRTRDRPFEFDWPVEFYWPIIFEKTVSSPRAHSLTRYVFGVPITFLIFKESPRVHNLSRYIFGVPFNPNPFKYAYLLGTCTLPPFNCILNYRYRYSIHMLVNTRTVFSCMFKKTENYLRIICFM